MRVVLKDHEDIEVSDFAGEAFQVDADSSDLHFSALEMFATSIALCTYSVLASYAMQIDTESDEIKIRLRWTYADKPYRVEQIQMDIDWPGLPESRFEAARRAAGMCTLHNTLARPPEFTTQLNE